MERNKERKENKHLLLRIIILLREEMSEKEMGDNDSELVGE